MIDSSVLGTGEEHEEGITAGRGILLAIEDTFNDLRSICKELLTLGKLVDGHDSKNCIASNERVTVLNVGENGGNERFDDLSLGKAAEESERHTSDILVRMLQVIPQVLTDENHLRQDATGGISLVDYLKIEKEELLDRVVLRRKDVTDDCDEKLWKSLTVKKKHDSLFHGINLGVDVVSLERQFDLVGQGRGSLVEVDEESARPLHLAACRTGRGNLVMEGRKEAFV